MKIKSFCSSSPLFRGIEFSNSRPICFIQGRSASLVSNTIRSMISEAELFNTAPVCPEKAIIENSVTLDIHGSRFTLTSLSDGGDGFSLRLFTRTDDGAQILLPPYILHCTTRYDGFINVFTSDRLTPNTEPKGYSDRIVDSFEMFFGELITGTEKGDTRPVFVYNFFDRLDAAVDPCPFIHRFSRLGRQVLITVCEKYPSERINHSAVQIIKLKD